MPHVTIEQAIRDIKDGSSTYGERKQEIGRLLTSISKLDLHYLRKEREFEVTGSQRDAAEAKKWRKLETGLFEQVDTIY